MVLQDTGDLVIGQALGDIQSGKPVFVVLAPGSQGPAAEQEKYGKMTPHWPNANNEKKSVNWKNAKKRLFIQN